MLQCSQSAQSPARAMRRVSRDPETNGAPSTGPGHPNTQSPGSLQQSPHQGPAGMGVCLLTINCPYGKHHHTQLESQPESVSSAGTENKERQRDRGATDPTGPDLHEVARQQGWGSSPRPQAQSCAQASPPPPKASLAKPLSLPFFPVPIHKPF